MFQYIWVSQRAEIILPSSIDQPDHLKTDWPRREQHFLSSSIPLTFAAGWQQLLCRPDTWLTTRATIGKPAQRPDASKLVKLLWEREREKEGHGETLPQINCRAVPRGLEYTQTLANELCLQLYEEREREREGEREKERKRWRDASSTDRC